MLKLLLFWIKSVNHVDFNALNNDYHIIYFIPNVERTLLADDFNIKQAPENGSLLYQLKINGLLLDEYQLLCISLAISTEFIKINSLCNVVSFKIKFISFVRFCLSTI